MSRPVSIRGDVIIKIARQVFLAQGYQASTTEIARRAGVSESSLFKHFKTKTALFLAAMDIERCEQKGLDRLMAGVGKAAIKQTLEAYGRHLLRELQLMAPRVLMVTSSGGKLAKKWRATRGALAVQYAPTLARYLRAEIQCGRFRMTQPEIQAEIFVGAILHYVFCKTLFDHQVASRDAYVRALVRNILSNCDVMPRQRKALSRCLLRQTGQPSKIALKRGTCRARQSIPMPYHCRF